MTTKKKAFESVVDTQTAWKTEDNSLVDLNTLKSLFYNEDWVFITVDLYASCLSEIPLIITRSTNSDGKVNNEPIANHPLKALLDNPNQYQDGNTWLYNVGIEDLLMGNVVNWYQATNKQLTLLPSESITIMPEDRDDRLSLLYMYNADAMFQSKNQLLTFKEDVICHTKRPNPSTVFWGMTPFVPTRKAVLFNRYTTDYLNAYYQRQAIPGMVLEVDKNVNEEQALRLIRSFENAYTGRRNQRRTMVLPKGVKGSNYTPTVADQRLIELVNSNRETLLQATKTPKHAVGLQENGSLGSEEHKQALKWYYQAAVLPGIKRICQSLTVFFRKQKLLAINESITPDLTNIEILREGNIDKADLATKMLSTRTYNEVRKEVWGVDPVTGGDVILALEQLKTPASMPMTFSLPPTPQKEILPILNSKTSNEKLDVFHLLEQRGFYKDWLNFVAKAEDEEILKTKNQMVDLNLNHLIETGKIAAEVLKKVMGAKATSDETSVKEQLESMFQKLESQYKENYLNILKSSMNVGYDSKLEMIINDTDRRAVEALKERGEKERYAILSARGINTFSKINETSTNLIMREVERGFRDNLTIVDLTKNILGRLLGTTDDMDKAYRRAETIARTETLTAVSVGQYAASSNANAVIKGGVVKVWINANDARVRGNPGGLYPNAEADHWSLQGEYVSFNNSFSNGLEYPRDVKNGSAAEVINCRCTWLDVPASELNDMGIPGLHSRG